MPSAMIGVLGPETTTIDVMLYHPSYVNNLCCCWQVTNNEQLVRSASHLLVGEFVSWYKMGQAIKAPSFKGYTNHLPCHRVGWALGAGVVA